MIKSRIKRLEKLVCLQGGAIPSWALKLADELILRERHRLENLPALNRAIEEATGRSQPEVVPYLETTDVEQLARRLSRYGTFDNYQACRGDMDLARVHQAIAEVSHE